MRWSRFRLRTLFLIVMATVLSIGSVHGQDPSIQVTVTNQTPEPAWIEEEVSATLTATVMNPPTGLTGPTWTWSKDDQDAVKWSGTGLKGNVTGTTGNGVSPIVVTSAGHGLSTGMQITLAGVKGNLAANGAFTVTRIDADSFSLTGSTGNGAYDGEGSWTTYVIDASKTYTLMLTADTTEPNKAVLKITCNVAGFFEVSPKVTAKYKDKYNVDKVVLTARPKVYVTAVDVVFTPDTLYVGVNETPVPTVTTTITPATSAVIGAVSYESTNAAGAASEAICKLDPAPVATATGHTLSVKGVDGGEGKVFAKMGAPARRFNKRKLTVTVIKVDITNINSATPDAALASPVNTEKVAIGVDLKAKVTPAGLAGLTYQWIPPAGDPVKTYDLRIDDATGTYPKFIDLTDLTSETLKFFWKKDSTPGTPYKIEVWVVKAGKVYKSPKLDFNVTQQADPNQNIYCYYKKTGVAGALPVWKGGVDGTAEERLRRCPSPAAPATFYQVLRSHSRWHEKQKMLETPAVNPTGTPAAGPLAGWWGDNGASGQRGGNDHVGSAFLIWHWRFIEVHDRWRSKFNMAAVDPAWPGGMAAATTTAVTIPDWLMTNPPVASTNISENWKGYVRLGEFKDLDELGAEFGAGLDVATHPSWHDSGHVALGFEPRFGPIDAALGNGMNDCTWAPGAVGDVFWKWHKKIDEVRVAYGTGPDFAGVMPGGRDPAPAAVVASVPSIFLNFDKRVSFNFATAGVFPTKKENTRQLKKTALRVKSGAGAMDEEATLLADFGAAAGITYRNYKFTVPPPIPGVVTVELTGATAAQIAAGTAGLSYKSDSYTFTYTPPAPTVPTRAPVGGAKGTAAVAVTLTGTNFAGGVDVRLTKMGQPDIVATAVKAVSHTSITCNVNLTGVAAGDWDVVVKNTNTAAVTCPMKFTVTP